MTLFSDIHHFTDNWQIFDDGIKLIVWSLTKFKKKTSYTHIICYTALLSYQVALINWKGHKTFFEKIIISLQQSKNPNFCYINLVFFQSGHAEILCFGQKSLLLNFFLLMISTWNFYCLKIYQNTFSVLH